MELHLAARAGDMTKLKQLLAQGADLESRYSPAPAHGACSCDLTPLMEAARGGEASAETVRFVLDVGTDVHARSAAGATALWYAAAKGDPARVRVLLASGGDPNSAADNGPAPLTAAAELSYLFAEGNAVTKAGGSPDCVRLLLDAGANVDVRGPNNDTALMCAAEGGSGPCVELLLKAGADPNARDSFGNTALTLASSRAAVNALVAAGAASHPSGPSIQDVLWSALFHERAEAVAALLDAGASPNQPDVNGFTPLMHARDPESVRALIAAGADVNARSRDGMTPLLCCIFFQAAHACVTTLLEGGADAEAFYIGPSDTYRAGN